MQTESLAKMIGVESDSKRDKYFHAGGLKWAKKVMRMGIAVLPRQEAANGVLQRVKDAWPADWQIGSTGKSKNMVPGDDRYLPKFHWPQLAWYNLWKVRCNILI